MHVRLLALGSRGDVQPYIPLALALKAAGFDISLAVTSDFVSMVERYGLPTIASNLNLQNAVTDANRDSSARGWKARRQSRQARVAFFDMLLAETLRLSEGADALVYAPAAVYSAPHVAEKLGIPAIPTALQPFLHPTGEVPAVGTPILPLKGGLGRVYNRLTYSLLDAFIGLFLGGPINLWRQDTLGLPPMKIRSPFEHVRQSGVPVLYGISPSVLPKPAEWPPNARLTGYWFLEARTDRQPSAPLADFLRAGPPPVYIGFGSMASRDPERIARIVLDAVKQAGIRAILATGWGGLKATDLPDNNVLVIQDVRHSWLFPQVSAVVHHGGAGTTAAGLRAGLPSIIVPFKNDQFFWGQRVAALGVGPSPIPQKELTVERLASALQTATQDATMRQNATSLGQKIRAEDGVANAVDLITRILSP